MAGGIDREIFGQTRAEHGKRPLLPPRQAGLKKIADGILHAIPAGLGWPVVEALFPEIRINEIS
jgi:hypothetical protein